MVDALSFDRFLRFVRIPGTTKSEHTKPDTDRNSVVDVFEYLHNKGVTHIIYLEVGSDPDFAQSDIAITRSIKPFTVAELNWKKTDISSDILREAAPNVRKLHLYSSGNMGVLKSWGAENGLPSLSKVRCSPLELGNSIRRKLISCSWRS